MTLDVLEKPVPVLRLFLRMGGWIVVMLGLICAGLSLISAADSDLAQRFDKDGRQTSATVSHKRFAKTRNPDGSLSTSYWVTLRYRTGAGEVMMLERLVNGVEYRRSEQGARVDLRYLPDAPFTVELATNWFRTMAQRKQSLALGAGLIGLLLLWVIGRRSVDAIRARDYGTREKAVVTGIRRVAIRLPGWPDRRLVWLDRHGNTGQSLRHHARSVMAVHPGAVIDIYRGPTQSWWAGDVGHKAGSDGKA
ncbi:DUF3592 domain-containing protein [uncultured Roseovarius sp.]|uniref:DUF3592 domain-containing protein n=1 Tax=uncultured Roseovarius sp. TaxID=293344 RepID=UPI0026068942|nr:DUF3592 domain-containing protein [uncultured Roseovarius sp.]